MSKEPEVSHGRGGAGNITHDDTKYVDGEVVRTGDVGSHQDGPYSTGRGGAANIGDTHAQSGQLRVDKDVVPDEATRETPDQDYHTGRGGAGNEHLAAGHEHHNGVANQGLADKLKGKLFGVFNGKK